MMGSGFRNRQNGVKTANCKVIRGLGATITRSTVLSAAAVAEQPVATTSAGSRTQWMKWTEESESASYEVGSG